LSPVRSSSLRDGTALGRDEPSFFEGGVGGQFPKEIPAQQKLLSSASASCYPDPVF